MLKIFTIIYSMNDFVNASEYNPEEKYNLFLLVDMDYFYAACEIRRNPKLKDKPVAVYHSVGERGAILTANYIARKLGIKSGDSLSKAKKVKGLVLIEADMEYYKKVSNEIFRFLKGFGEVEQVSIDEGYILFHGTYEEAFELAKTIQEAIYQKFSLPCSIGIGYNRVIAKIACEYAKPNGIKMVRRSEGEEFMKNVEVDKMYGVGEKTTKLLNEIGIYKGEDILKADPSKLREVLGDRTASMLYLLAKGEDPYKYSKREFPKSIGVIRTLEEDKNKDEILELVLAMVYEISAEMQTNDIFGKTLTLKVIYSDFENRSYSKSLSEYTNDFEKFAEIAKELLSEVEEKKIRRVGITISNLIPRRGKGLI